MNYDKLTDELDKKMLDFNLKMTGFLATLLVKPLALATDVFFRKDFGERYLTPNSAVVSILLWVAASVYASHETGRDNPILQGLWALGLHEIAQWISEHDYAKTIGWIMVIASGFMVVRNLTQTRARTTTGHMWYSLSRGASIFGNENKTRDLMIAAMSVGILCLFAPTLALLFAVSRIVSYQVESSQQNAFYSRYLDAMDAKIQAEYLQRALDKGEPPDNTEGLYCPLPKSFKGEHRQRVARVVAGGPFNPGATQERPHSLQSFPPPRGGEPAPAAAFPSQEVAMKSALQDARNTAAETLSSILKSKRIIRFAVVGLILLAVVAVATPVVRFIHAEMTRPAAVAASTPAHPANPNRGNSTAPAPQARTQSQATPPVATPAPDIKSAEEKSNFEARVQAAVDTLRRQDAEKAAAALEAQKREEQAKEQAALEAQKRQEAERLAALEIQKQQEKERAAALELQKQQETAKVLEQVKTALADQEAQRAKLLADCETRLTNNTNKIAKVATASRKTLQHNNDVLKEKIETALKTEDDSFKHIEGLLPPLAPSPQPDPRQVGIELTNYMAKVEKVRQQLTGMLADQDTDISNAPPQKGLLDFINITVH